MKQSKTIGIIGLGNIGNAIANCSGPPSIQWRTIGFDIDKKKCAKIKKLGIRIAKNSCELVKMSDIIILAVKPQEIGLVLNEIKNFLNRDKLIISAAAGISTEYIERIVGKIRIIRVMPNIAILVKESASAICRGKYATAHDEEIGCKIFSTMGKTFKVSEKFMDSVTALSGSGPAYFFEIINSFVKAGMRLGFSLSQAKNLVFQTARGAVKMLEQINNDPVALRKMVTSKRGTTIEGLKILWDNHLEEILIKAVSAAKKRAGQLAKFKDLSL